MKKTKERSGNTKKTKTTSKKWWEATKADPKKLEAWLKAQYHGEMTAALRIQEIWLTLPPYTRMSKTLQKIYMQEWKHGNWIAMLLKARGLDAALIEGKKERYWKKTLPKNYLDMSFKKLMAVGAHAEKMRLERIKVIANDKTAPQDVREVFKNILPDERFHERTFRRWAGISEYISALKNHQKGKNALGLIA